MATQQKMLDFVNDLPTGQGLVLLVTAALIPLFFYTLNKIDGLDDRIGSLDNAIEKRIRDHDGEVERRIGDHDRDVEARIRNIQGGDFTPRSPVPVRPN